MQINETFQSIQGEGINVGKPSIFVRFQGCNRNCLWCDTKYALSAEGIELTVGDIISQVEIYRLKRVVLTGGEPLIQPAADLKVLFEELRYKGYEVEVETNGSICIDSLVEDFNNVFWTISSKTIKDKDIFLRYASICQNRMQYKIVYEDKEKAFGDNDSTKLIRFILENTDYNIPVVIQPEYAGVTFQKVLKECEDFVRNVRVRFIPQIHKLTGLK